jgi:prevent-host-death family protein
MKTRLVAAEPVSAYDAKTHLPKLIERAERGERFVITRHGRPVAQLIPYQPDDRQALEQALTEVERRRARLDEKGVRLADVIGPEGSARGLAHVGHRY